MRDTSKTLALCLRNDGHWSYKDISLFIGRSQAVTYSLINKKVFHDPSLKPTKTKAKVRKQVKRKNKRRKAAYIKPFLLPTANGQFKVLAYNKGKRITVGVFDCEEVVEKFPIICKVF